MLLRESAPRRPPLKERFLALLDAEWTKIPDAEWRDASVLIRQHD